MTYMAIPGVDNLPDEVSLILGVIEEVTGKKLADLKTQTRFRSIVFPRMVAIHLIKMNTELSHSMIGNIFELDHSTVAHAIKCVLNDRDIALRQLFFEVESIFYERKRNLLMAE